MIPEPEDLPSATTYSSNAASGFVSQVRILPGQYAMPILRQLLDDLTQRWLGEAEAEVVMAARTALDTAAAANDW